MRRQCGQNLTLKDLVQFSEKLDIQQQLNSAYQLSIEKHNDQIKNDNATTCRHWFLRIKLSTFAFV